MLKEIIDQIECDSHFQNALETLSQDIHVYETESDGTVYEDYYFDNYEWRTGVSKVCILFDNFVLKKSFSGWVVDYDCENDEYYDEPSFEEWTVDYAQLEYKVYETAVFSGVSKFFAEIEFLGDGIYAQERCDVTIKEAVNSKEVLSGITGPINPKQGIEWYCMENNLEKLLSLTDCTVMSYLLGTYSIQDLYLLQDFLSKYDINDVHYGNIGWFNGQLKIFDYCGYCSETNKKIKNFQVVKT